jgi:DNA-binding phage protein
MMALTRDFRQTVVQRMDRDPMFARAMLHEAATLLLNGEPGPARLVVRDLVNATLGFEALAKATGTPSKSLHRMLSERGNPGMDKLACIFRALCRELAVALSVQSGSAPRRSRRAA